MYEININLGVKMFMLSTLPYQLQQLLMNLEANLISPDKKPCSGNKAIS